MKWSDKNVLQLSNSCFASGVIVLFTRGNSLLILFFIENETNYTSNTDENSEIVMQRDVINSC